MRPQPTTKSPQQILAEQSARMSQQMASERMAQQKLNPKLQRRPNANPFGQSVVRRRSYGKIIG